VVFSNLYVDSFKKYIVTDTVADHTMEVGLVFGSGINIEGKPYKQLEARLDSAAKALKNGVVQKLILSGDNRFENYNEPDAMINYLVDQKNIERSKLQADYGGRSTYESCERAAKIFQVDKLLLFSSNSHLPRAIFTCRSFGIESYGVGNSVEANNATRREFLARVKSMFNVYVYGERSVLGDPIPL
jgi:vancomycin permeability regulator SanA